MAGKTVQKVVDGELVDVVIDDADGADDDSGTGDDAELRT